MIGWILALLIAGAVVPCAASETVWQRREALQKEDLRSVATWFNKRDPSLSKFSVGDKRSIDGSYAAMVVTGFDGKQQPPSNPRLGVFVVYGKTNQVYLVLDIRSAPQGYSPELRKPTSEVVYVTWVSDYGFYGGTLKYVYNLATRRALERYAYRRFSVQTAQRKPDQISFVGAYAPSAALGTEAQLTRTVLVRTTTDGHWYADQASADVVAHEPDVPAAVLKSIPSPDRSSPVQRRTLQVARGLWLYVPESGIYVVNSRGVMRFFPIPVPTATLYEKYRRATGRVGSPPGTLESSIGPYAFDGERLWFVNSFYDGEGISGVGALGSFDLATRKYEMRYLREIVPWSGSALLLDHNSIWIGLMRRPEGAEYGGGVLRFDTWSGSVRKYPIDDYVVTITRAGSAVYFGTTNGVYMYATDQEALFHIRVEPGSRGLRDVVVERTTVE